MSRKIFDYLKIIPGISAEKSKDILLVNPTVASERVYAESSQLSVYAFNKEQVQKYALANIKDSFLFKNNGLINWIDIGGICKADIENLSTEFNVHALLMEDIFSVGQRPKMDVVEGVLFCQLNMLYYDQNRYSIESEQVSFVLGHDYLISIQEDAARDLFDPVRNKLQLSASKLRQRKADYLLYCLLDVIVDNYFIVMEKLALRIEQIEDEVNNYTHQQSLKHINLLRKELILLQRHITPVRDLIAGIIRSESRLIEKRNIKYFKDINDHITQAYELSENYRDMIAGIQDLYINNVNLKLNEIMKVIAVFTCLMAPATVIGGIFGMNFDVIPYSHMHYGFYWAVSAMIMVPLLMLVVFKYRKWF